MKLLRTIRSWYYKLLIYRADSFSVGRVFSKFYGVKIGANSRFTGKKISFGSEPYIIEIGDNVTITPGVKFQTHDGGVALFRKEYPGMNVFGKIKIGNNVFIGEDAMIMYGVTVGDNVVIGARSLVTHDIPSNSVVVGVPARVIKTLEEYKATSLAKAVFIKDTTAAGRKEEILLKIEPQKKI